jgi:hypothetical protein
MSAPTVSVRYGIAQAGEKGLGHIASQRNTGTWIGRCGRQVRGQEIRVREGLAGILWAEAHEGTLLCPDCADLAALVGAALEAAEGRA